MLMPLYTCYCHHYHLCLTLLISRLLQVTVAAFLLDHLYPPLVAVLVVVLKQILPFLAQELHSVLAQLVAALPLEGLYRRFHRWFLDPVVWMKFKFCYCWSLIYILSCISRIPFAIYLYLSLVWAGRSLDPHWNVGRLLSLPFAGSNVGLAAVV